MNYSNEENIYNNFDVIILKVDSKKFGLGTKSYNLDIMGRKMIDWVKLATNSESITEVVFDEKKSVFDQVKPYTKNSKYTIVLYSDTPLINFSTIKKMLDYISLNGYVSANFSRASIFDTEYLKSADTIYSSNESSFLDDDFFVCDDIQSYARICEIMKNKIIAYHLNRGVIIKNPSSVYIEINVDIEENVLIEPNNIIRGDSKIGAYTLLGANNVIIDSIIGETNEIYSSNLNNVFTEKNVKILPYCQLSKSAILMDSKINSFTRIKNKKIKPNSIIKSYTDLSN